MNVENGLLESRYFDVFQCSSEELDKCVMTMFMDMSFLQVFSIKKSCLFSYIQTVKANYQDHPYHNYEHAVETAQFVYMVYKKAKLFKEIASSNCAAILLAAFNHDIAHPGKSTAYQKRFSTDLYARYGPESTLEKYHVEVAKSLWNNPEHPIFSKQEKLEVYTEKLILSTDMQQHDKWLLFCRDQTQNKGLRFGIALIKCADLSQLIRGRNIADNWLIRLKKELYLEKASEVQMYNDLGDNKIFIENSLLLPQEFIQKKARPLYELLGELLPPVQGFKKYLFSEDSI